jgi:probable HAF family extracellular repeat protein
MKGCRLIAKVMIVFFLAFILCYIPVYADDSNELLQNPSFTVNTGHWSLWSEGTAKVAGARDTINYDSAPASYRVNCISKGTSSSDIQLFTTGLKVEAGKRYKLSFRAKSEHGEANPIIRLMKACSPWNLYAQSQTVTIVGDWATQEMYFTSNTTDSNARITFFLGNKMDDGATIYFDTFSFTEVTGPILEPIIITDENNGQSFNVSLGQEVQIFVKLHTKFSCDFITSPDNTILTPTGYSHTELFQDESGYSIYGIVWKYRATGQGETEIKLKISYYTGEEVMIYSYKIITGNFTPTVKPTPTTTNTPINTPNTLPNVVIKGLSSLGGTYSTAYAINDKGQIVGDAYLPGDSIIHAFVWKNGVMKDLGTLGGKNSCAYDINEKGQVVGYSDIAGDNARHAFIYENGVMKDLGTLGGLSSFAEDINNQGQVVGYSDIAGDNARHAFIYENGVMKDLGTLGGRVSEAYGINDKGQVVGNSFTAGDKAIHAFIYENGVMKDLGTLGGLSSFAEDINNQGQIVGRSYVKEDNEHHAFIWENGVMKNLGAFGEKNSNAYGINENGKVVGNSNYVACIWEDGVMHYLTDTESSAYDINNNGQVVGQDSDNAFICETKMPELLKNPSFSDNTNDWHLWTDTGGKASGQRDIINYDSAPAGYRITCNSIGTRIYSIQFYTNGLNLEAGKTYKVSFKAKASNEFRIPSIVLMRKDNPWTSYSTSVTADVSNEWKEYSYTMRTNTNDPNARLSFFLGKSMPEGTVLYLDSISVKLID